MSVCHINVFCQYLLTARLCHPAVFVPVFPKGSPPPHLILRGRGRGLPG
jgi:hypothetical protein